MADTIKVDRAFALTRFDRSAGNQSALVCDLHAALSRPPRHMKPLHPVFRSRGDFVTGPEISQVFGEACSRPTPYAQPRRFLGIRPLDDWAVDVCRLETLSDRRARPGTR